MATTNEEVSDLNDESERKRKLIGKYDLLLLGLLTVVGGQTGGWNAAYDDGIIESVIIICILSVGYLIMTFCLAEMISALPFSGGIFGLSRAFLHPTLGFFVAMFELSMNVFYIAPCVYQLALLPVEADLLSDDYVLYLCLAIYFLVVALLVMGGSIQWSVTKVLDVVLLLFILIYQFGSLGYVDMKGWGGTTSLRKTTISTVLREIPLVSPIYLGVQSLPLMSHRLKEPKKDIPMVMLTVLGCSVVSAIGFMLLTCSQFPGIEHLSDDPQPLRYGYSYILHISEENANLMAIPFLFGTILGFTFFCGRQITVMANSGMLPSRLVSYKTPYFGTYFLTFLYIASLSFALNLLTYFNESFNLQCFLISSLSSYLVYMVAMVAFIRFHGTYYSLERFFRSPLQIWGGYLGIVIFLFCFIGGSIFQEGGYLPLIVIVIIAVLSITYHVFFAGEPMFSEEEKNELFKAYLMNANLAAKKRMLKNKGKHAGSRSNVGGSSVSTDQDRSRFRQLEIDRHLRSVIDNISQEGDDSEGEDDGSEEEEKESLSSNGGDIEEGNQTFTRPGKETLEPDYCPATPEITSAVAISPAEPVSSSLSTLSAPPTPSYSHRYLSAKIFQFLSTKFNQVAPAEPVNIASEV